MAQMKDYDHDHEDEVTLFAETNFRNQRRVFGIKTDDRRRHMYVIGKTGMGKTTMLENMVISDMQSGHGLAYVDPHGDTAQKLLDFVPPNRINDVVYFNPSDLDFPLGFNVFESIDPAKKHLVAAGLMGVFKKIWPDVWSARMEYILLNTILALLDYPGATLLGINRLLVDEEYRKKVVSLVQDPVVKTFWVKEFAAFSEKYRTEAIAPVQNKVGQFLSAALIRNIVAQVKSTIDMRDIMDNQKIFILNLSKGLIGEENSRLLGAMVITRLQLAAMERVDIPEAQRKDFYLYVDEFQNFATDSFANILSEARKYHLNLIVAHQYISQLVDQGNTKVRDAIFGNVGTIVTFRVGGNLDAELLETEFTPRFTQEDLVNLGKYEVYLKLMIDGVASEPFSANTLPPISHPTASTDKVIKVSRERYAVPRAVIEEKVLKWSGIGTADEGAIIKTTDEEEMVAEQIAKLQASSPKIQGPADVGEGKALFEIACSVCGKVQKLSFEPDRSRPWYCKEDLEKRRVETEVRRKMGLPSMPPPPGWKPPAGIQPSVPLAPSAPAAPPGEAFKEAQRSAVSFDRGPRPPSSGRPAAPRRDDSPRPPRKPAAMPLKPAPSAPPAPEVKPVSLSAMFGKKLSEPGQEPIEEEGEEESGQPEPEIKPLGDIGLVQIKGSGREAPKPAAPKPPAVPKLPPKPQESRPAAKPGAGQTPKKPLKPGDVVKF